MSSAPTSADHLFVGADIAARSFTAAWRRADGSLSRPVRCEQTPDGFTGLQQVLAATGVAPEQTLVVMEATSTSHDTTLVVNSADRPEWDNRTAPAGHDAQNSLTAAILFISHHETRLYPSTKTLPAC